MCIRDRYPPVWSPPRSLSPPVTMPPTCVGLRNLSHVHSDTTRLNSTSRWWVELRYTWPYCTIKTFSAAKPSRQLADIKAVYSIVPPESTVRGLIAHSVRWRRQRHGLNRSWTCNSVKSQLSVCVMSVKCTHHMLIPLIGSSKKSYTVWVENAHLRVIVFHWLLAVIIKRKTKKLP